MNHFLPTEEAELWERRKAINAAWFQAIDRAYDGPLEERERWKQEADKLPELFKIVDRRQTELRRQRTRDIEIQHEPAPPIPPGRREP